MNITQKWVDLDIYIVFFVEVLSNNLGKYIDQRFIVKRLADNRKN